MGRGDGREGRREVREWGSREEWRGGRSDGREGEGKGRAEKRQEMI